MRRMISAALLTVLIASGQHPGTDDSPAPIGSAAVSMGTSDVTVARTSTSPSADHSPSGDVSNPRVSESLDEPKKPFDFAACLAGRDDARTCYRPTPPTTDPASPTASAPVGTPAITLTDLAQFAPAPPTITTEPDTAGIAHLPVNFTTSATVHTLNATILGTPLAVRFTPVSYDYDFGDGSTAALTTPGRTWTQLHQDPHTPTPTSHTYAAPGAYTARLTTRYTADIDTGAGWTAIPGNLALTSPPLDLTVYAAHTALVAHTCVEQPTSPGC